jgi:hypothetical protein
MLPFRQIARADDGHAQFVSRSILSVRLPRDGHFADCGLRIADCGFFDCGLRIGTLGLRIAIRVMARPSIFDS